MEKENHHRVILGAGLTGLSAAYHGGGRVFERSDKCGGTCMSPQIKGYTFDLGIHVLHTRNEYVLKLLKRDLKIRLNEQNRLGRVYSYNTFTRYPFQANTYGLPIPIVKECLTEYIKAYCKSNSSPDRRSDNYEDWIISNFGKGIASHFMLPYSDKFWTVPAKELTTDWLNIRVPQPSLEEVVEGALSEQAKEFGPNAIFRYPLKNGIAAIPEAFVKNGVTVFTNKEAVQIDMKRKVITFSDGAVERYDALISTIPLPDLFRITGSPEVISKEIGQLRYNSILCINLGIKKDALTDKHWIFYPEKKYSFFRLSFLKNFSLNMVPNGRSSITAEVAYSQTRKINKNTIVDSVIKDLIRTNVLNIKDRIDLVDLRDIKYGYVIYDHNRNRSLKKIKNYFRKHHIIVAGRYGSWEYQWIDDAILDGKRAAEEILTLKNEKYDSMH